MKSSWSSCRLRLDPSKPHQIEFHHEGDVISTAGERVFFVSSRGIWYPRVGSAFARFDLTFHYPRDLVLVSTGDLVSTRTEGEWRISSFHAPSPIRFAGFNLGAYNCVSRARGVLKVDVCANREMEAALRRPAVPDDRIALAPAQTIGRVRRPLLNPPPLAPPPNPAARLDKLADDVAGALEFMSAQFGPPPIRHVTVSPIPGSFGQGFPGLIYLSTLSYLDVSQRPAAARNTYKDLLFSDVLVAHEAAHQWWGNLVTAAGYQDEWLMESLADYSALMYLEKKSGPRALDTVLDRYRNDLLKKTDSGRTVESAGPIVWGIRLLSSQAPQSWRAITYEKGAWILHMLRRRLGDERFTAMLREICAKYRFRPLATEEFRQIAQRFSPPKSPDPELRAFFDNWIYGTGIPAVKMTQSIRAGKITGTLTATGAGDDFTGLVPVELPARTQESGVLVASLERWLLVFDSVASARCRSEGLAFGQRHPNKEMSTLFLSGRNAVVTGGTRGIGLAIARALAEAGAAVAICGRTAAAVEKTARELAAQTAAKVVGAPADVSDSGQVSNFFQFVDATLGGLDILINNAGVGVFRSAADLSLEDWHRTLDTNLSGVFYCCHEALPRMKRRGGGYVINIGSLAGKNAIPGGAAYNASKFGLNGFSEAMMLDHRYDDIRVSTIMPGSVATDFDSGATKAEWKIAPEDIAAIVITLLGMPARTLVSRVEVRPAKPKK